MYFVLALSLSTASALAGLFGIRLFLSWHHAMCRSAARSLKLRLQLGHSTYPAGTAGRLPFEAASVDGPTSSPRAARIVRMSSSCFSFQLVLAFGFGFGESVGSFGAFLISVPSILCFEESKTLRGLDFVLRHICSCRAKASGRKVLPHIEHGVSADCAEATSSMLLLGVSLTCCALKQLKGAVDTY